MYKRKRLLLIPILLLVAASCSGKFYNPLRHRIYEPGQFGYEYREIKFRSLDGTTLHGWFFRATHDNPERGTVIQFHGGDENVSSHFTSMVWLTREGYNLFIFDYQGFGHSEGLPNQQNLNSDGVAALNWANNYNLARRKELKLIAYGQSTGGTVLLRALHDYNDKDLLSGVVVESGFESYREVLRTRLSEKWYTWIFQPLAYVLVKDVFSPKEYIADIAPVPLLVIHGDADREVPVKHGLRIFELANEPKTFWAVPGGGHVTAMSEEQSGGYRLKLVEYLNDL
jgi:hypothetical protein